MNADRPANNNAVASAGQPLRWYDLAFTGPHAELEAAFRENYAVASLGQVRLACALGFGMFTAFGVLDIALLGEEAASIWWVRYGLLCPLAAVTFALTWAPGITQVLQPTLALLVILSGAGNTAMVLLAGEPVSYSYYAGNMLVIMFGYTFVRLRFLWACGAGWVVVLIYEYAALYVTHTPWEVILNNNFFFMSTNLLGMLAAYRIETFTRRDWLQARELDRQRSELVQARDTLEERVRDRSAAALAAARAKSNFLANMSHEIRTPMNGVLGMLELARASRLDSEQRDWIDTAMRSSVSLLALLDDILDLSKIEAGKMEMVPEDAVPADLVEEVVALLRPQAERKGLELEVLASESCAQPVRVDPFRVRQVLLNVIGNAVKFTRSGRVSVCARVEGGRHLVIEVDDTGIGIGASQLEHLFDAFSQADGSASRNFGGTGLGLSISRQLTELMGGTISVESSQSRGSTFTVTIPVSRAPGRQPGRDRERQPQDATELHGHVLLVEDNAVNQKFAVALLKRAGLTCEVAVNGRDGIEKLVGRRPDLVLMDCQMPEMDGYEATRRIRAAALPGQPHLPVIALTANAMAGDRQRCIEAGMDDYIAKPFRPDALRAVLARWLPGATAPETARDDSGQVAAATR